MIRWTRRVLLLLPACAIAGILHLACGGNERDKFDEDEASVPPFGSEAGSEVGTDASCLSETLAAQPIPLAMLLVMDRSGSMLAPSDNPKWNQARNAMVGFSDTPGVVGTKLGLTVFPPDPSSGLDQCNPKSYAPIVPIALMPGNAVPIKEALSVREAVGGTPMGGALQGGLDVMKDHLAKNPLEEGIIMLVTDGDPAACTGDTVQNVAFIAERAAQGTPRIRTFVVGMEGATFASLDVIASAGKGTPKAFNTADTDAGVSTQQRLIDSLDQIRSGALGCEYLLPKPDPAKGTVDPGSVTIDFIPGKNEPKQTIRPVADAEACGESTGGFYYDDPKTPTRIILCPASCDSVRDGTAVSKLDVVLGCIQQPH